MSEENKEIKLKESKYINDLQRVEADLNQFKVENQNLVSKYNELHFTYKSQASSVNKLQDEIDSKSAEINQFQSQNVSNTVAKEDGKVVKNQKLLGELKLMMM